jgi:hypothetical protein
MTPTPLTNYLIKDNDVSRPQAPMILGVCDHDGCPRHRCKQKPPFYAAILNKKKKRK